MHALGLNRVPVGRDFRHSVAGIRGAVMCLGVPGKVIRTFREHDVLMGKVDFGGVSKNVCLEHVPDVQTGQFVLVHVGFALSVIDEDEAARVFEYLRTMNQVDEVAAPAGGPPEGAS